MDQMGDLPAAFGPMSCVGLALIPIAFLLWAAGWRGWFNLDIEWAINLGMVLIVVTTCIILLDVSLSLPVMHEEFEHQISTVIGR